MNHRMMVTGLVCVLGGCVDGADPTPSAADEPMIDRTIEQLLPDGSQHVMTTQVTATQQRQELADRAQRMAGAARVSDGTGEVEQGLVSVDSGCAAASMWIFDNTGNTVGSWPLNHEIGFYKSSTAFPVCTDLRHYTRQCFFFGSTFSCQNWAADTGGWIGSYVDEQRPGCAHGIAGLGLPRGILQRGRCVGRRLGASHRDRVDERVTRRFAAKRDGPCCGAARRTAGGTRCTHVSRVASARRCEAASVGNRPGVLATA